MTTHSRILAWRISWTEESVGLYHTHMLACLITYLYHFWSQEIVSSKGFHVLFMIVSQSKTTSSSFFLSLVLIAKLIRIFFAMNKITDSYHLLLLLLLLLSCFSRVRLCATPQTAAHQAPPSLGFSRQEHWSGLPFPSPMHESEKWKWSRSVMSES